MTWLTYCMHQFADQKMMELLSDHYKESLYNNKLINILAEKYDVWLIEKHDMNGTSSGADPGIFPDRLLKNISPIVAHPVKKYKL